MRKVFIYIKKLTGVTVVQHFTNVSSDIYTVLRLMSRIFSKLFVELSSSLKASLISIFISKSLNPYLRYNSLELGPN